MIVIFIVASISGMIGYLFGVLMSSKGDDDL